MAVHALLICIIHRNRIITCILNLLAAVKELIPCGRHFVNTGLGKNCLIVEQGPHERLGRDIIPGFSVRGIALRKGSHSFGDGAFKLRPFHIWRQIHKIILAEVSCDFAEITFHNINLVAGINTGSQNITDIASRPVHFHLTARVIFLKAGNRGLQDLCLCLIFAPLRPIAENDIFLLSAFALRFLRRLRFLSGAASFGLYRFRLPLILLILAAFLRLAAAGRH